MLAVAAQLLSAPVFAGDDFHAMFAKGVSVHDAMNWASMTPDKKSYLATPFSDATHPFTESELASIRVGGFNFIRMTIDVGPFLQMKGPDRDALDAVLADHVKKAIAADLSIIVDFHPISQVPAYGASALVADADNQLFHDYGDLLTRTAKLLDGLKSPRIALELINEPQIGWSKAGHDKWQHMLETMYDAARRGSPTLKLILTGGDGGSANGLISVVPAHFLADSEAIFTFHYYLPYDFTMQALSGDATRKLEQDIPYPADARAIEDSLNALKKREEDAHMASPDMEQEQAKALPLLQKYHQSSFTKQTIVSTFDSVQNWARTNKLAPERILLGEFGVVRQYAKYHGAREEERMAWLSDVREAAETNQFSWDIWVYRGYGGMAIIKDDTTEQLDIDTLKALKLTH